MPGESKSAPIDAGAKDEAKVEAACLRLGPLAVSTASAEVEAFQRETGWNMQKPEARVPHTFPMRWLSVSEIKSLLHAKLGETGSIAIHESQSFAYQKKLGIDQAYRMSVEIRDQADPARLILVASIATLADEPCLTMETVLRLLPAKAPETSAA